MHVQPFFMQDVMQKVHASVFLSSFLSLHTYTDTNTHPALFTSQQRKTTADVSDAGRKSAVISYSVRAHFLRKIIHCGKIINISHPTYLLLKWHQDESTYALKIYIFLYRMCVTHPNIIIHLNKIHKNTVYLLFK